MKVFVVLFAIVAASTAASSSNSYIPPVADNSLPSQEYIPPDGNESSAVLADDGYRYRAVRKLKLRLRRDVNELSSSEYLPPAKDEIAVEPPASEKFRLVEADSEEKPILAEDGYRYKTVRRLKYRQRRDVSELPASKYLPPTEEPQEYLPPSEQLQDDAAATDSTPEEKTELAEDGYRYKTVRRLKYRQRRDVSELPANEYLPPSEELQEYLPPSEQLQDDAAATDSTPEEKTELAEDGYRYKTVRRLKYRQRRDVSELPANDYLPPSEELQDDAEATDSTPEEKTELAEDGYRYKTVRRLKYRQRRDVSELPANEYLPSSEELQEYLPPSEEVQDDAEAADFNPEDKTELAEDGYRYKTVRRLKYRQRRDVSELPPSKYLPPTEEPQEYLPPSEEIQNDATTAGSTPEENTELAEDGYRYKTVRRLKYRQRRDASELPANEYLPPTEELQDDATTIDSTPEEKTELAEDGYRYKTVRRLKYRHRRNVSELPANEYLPPSEELQDDAEAADSIPEDKTELADDGYRYKTVRRLKYRHRRDVNELPANEYLPPSEELQEYLPPNEQFQDDSAADAPIPEEKTELAEDGYRYKTVRRLKYRQRRDVSELPVNEYLPPAHADQSEEVSVLETVPEVKTGLADDGYRYKTVRRLKYRRQY